MKNKLYGNLPTMDIKELYGYINEINGGYIRANYHPEDNNIVILNYTEMATYERRWNKYTMSARGLILDLTDVRNNGIVYILAKPFPKFFNYGEMPELEKDLDHNDIETIMEKMDGSLGISYFFKNEIRFATRGSFSSEQAIKATEMWREKYSHKEDLDWYATAPVTYLVEIIYPENRVVVDYGGMEDLVMLGLTFLFVDEDTDATYNHLQWEANRLDMPLAEQYHMTFEEMLKKKKEISANEEGWILRFKNGQRLKIKGDEYINAHRIMHGLSDKAKVKAWFEGELEAYIMMLPEEFRDDLESLFDNLENIADSIKISVDSMLLKLIQTTSTQKEFAHKVETLVQRDYKHMMFRGKKHGEVPIELIKEHIYDNYQRYIEVISWMKKQDS